MLLAYRAVAAEAAWRATGGELSVRRITNSIRRGAATSLLIPRRSPKLAGHAGVVGEAMSRQPTWLEMERQEGVA